MEIYSLFILVSITNSFICIITTSYMLSLESGHVTEHPFHVSLLFHL